jgi:DNA-binding XRE family transcriptional regulator
VPGRRDERRWDSKFGRFVLAFGTEELARHLAVDRSAIYHWMGGSTSPRLAHAIKIQTLAKKRGVSLSLDEIYEVESERYTASSLKPQPARA